MLRYNQGNCEYENINNLAKANSNSPYQKCKGPDPGHD